MFPLKHWSEVWPPAAPVSVCVCVEARRRSVESLRCHKTSDGRWKVSRTTSAAAVTDIWRQEERRRRLTMMIWRGQQLSKYCHPPMFPISHLCFPSATSPAAVIWFLLFNCCTVRYVIQNTDLLSVTAAGNWNKLHSHCSEPDVLHKQQPK